MAEQAITFDCANTSLLGILHRPDNEAGIGVLVVVGGPQYRVGSHRQFVLLGRHLADNGIAALRFDYRGIGDSDGVTRNFLQIDQDIRSAADAFFQHYPTLTELYIWGLCDAASAALFYAPQDARIKGLILANPWVRTESGLAKAVLTDYYFKQLVSVELWHRLFTGKLNIIRSLVSLSGTILSIFKRPQKEAIAETTVQIESTQPQLSAATEATFPDRMLAGLKRFSGRILIVTCGEDLTAAEFINLVEGSRDWKKTLRKKHIDWKKLPESNHTFATRVWRDQVATWTSEWVLKK